MFNTSFEFNDLMYDLPDDEDFALIQNIKFTNNYLTTGSKKYAEAIKMKLLLYIQMAIYTGLCGGVENYLLRG